MVDLSQDQPLEQKPTPDVPAGAQPPVTQPVAPSKQLDDISSPQITTEEKIATPEQEEIKKELSELGIPPEGGSKKTRVLLAALGVLFLIATLPAAVYLVKQRQEIRKEAEVPPPSPVIVKSVAGQGVWKEVAHDGYPGCWSASQCSLVLYSPVNGWTSLGFDDSSWSTKNFTVDSGWWHKDAWVCKDTYFTSGPQTISIVDDRDTIFPNKNGVTGLHRRKFQLTIPDGYQIASAELRMFSDNKTAVYLNGDTGGGLIVSNIEGCYSASVSPQFLNQGENVLAIQLSNDHVNDADNPIGMQYELTINFTPSVTPTPTPTPTPSPTPSPTPTPTPSLLCTDLTASPSAELLATWFGNVVGGDTVLFTCRGVGSANNPINHFEFRIHIDGGEWENLGTASASPTDGEYQGQKIYTIPDYGCYQVECRACTSSDSSECTVWGQAQ